ncbi:MAG: cytochrome c family protein [Sphingomonadales bacterium]|nr:MAG: cytochrome c family protein [Sphingomonadales bacterium]TNF04685.1 MAG: cytochrome c family protein [Sphingomonadales bacterium]
MKVVKLLSSVLIVSGMMSVAPAHAAGDAAKGKTLYSRCAICHSLDAGKNMIGPSLSKVMGRKAGTLTGFSYSPAMKKYGKAWNTQTLDTYIAAPMKAVPGTKMVFAGLSNPKDRADLIAYLQSATK